MQTTWNDRDIEICGDWTARWLYLAPVYELKVDGETVDETSGPFVKPYLETTLQDDADKYHELRVEILSLAGIRPKCDIIVDGDVFDSGRIKVQNLLNPALVFFIVISICFMLLIGPKLLARYMF
jgi:hypothetical protein